MTLPDYVDNIIMVDDCSQESTTEVVRGYISGMEGQLFLIQHEFNQGVGGAIAIGYKWCRDQEIDIAVVTDGDVQRDCRFANLVLCDVV